MTRFLLLFLPLLAFASAIKVEHATSKPLGKILETNAKIIQLSNDKQEIVSRLSGHLERYYVKAGEYVKGGAKVAIIESIALSKMTAQYLALAQQEKTAKLQKNASTKLNKKGLSSQSDVSARIITLQEIRSKRNALASQLQSLGLAPNKLRKATDKLTIYAHADGVVGEIIAPLHSNVDTQTLLIRIVSQSNYYALAYVSVEDAMKVNKESKGWLHLAGKSYPSTFAQVLPSIDAQTQRAKVLFHIDKSPSSLLLGAFSNFEISLAPSQNAMMVKKTALSLYKGEWVVFVEKEHKEEAHHEEKSDHDHEEEKAEHDEHDHNAHDKGKKEKEHDEEGEEHEEHEEEAPYEARIIEIIAYAGDEVAIKGLEENEEYVSEGVYFVKSMLLKSSLGEHGH